MISAENDNKALVRRYTDLFNWNDLPAEEVVAPLASTFVYHRPGMPDVSGLADVRTNIEMYRSAFSDMHQTTERRATKSRAVGRAARLTKAS